MNRRERIVRRSAQSRTTTGVITFRHAMSEPEVHRLMDEWRARRNKPAAVSFLPDGPQPIITPLDPPRRMLPWPSHNRRP